MVKKSKVSRKVRRKNTPRKKITKPGLGSVFPLFGKLALRASALLLIVLLNWSGFSAIGKTAAYMMDYEESIGNTFVAGTLDFELAIPFDFPNSAIEIGGYATKTIDLVNLGNIHKYKVRADNFTGGLCDYLTLEANVDGDDFEYLGSLTSFEWGYATFTEPDTWDFTLNLASSTPEDIIGETCNFDFVFWGSQTRHDLPFGMGFNDEEQEDNKIKAQICYDAETRSMGYWKTHPDAYKSYLSQYLGCNSSSSECILGYEEISNQSEVNEIFNANNSIMRNKLKKQLLAMKFNIAHFKVGEHIYATMTDSFNTIVGEADALLQQTPAPSNEVGPLCNDSCNETNNNCTAYDVAGTACAGGFCDNTGTCVPNCVPTTEICDGQDNDCDGQVDESFPESACFSCVTSIPPYVPILGYYQCINGVLTCICP